MSKCILLVALLVAVYMACSVSAQGGIARCCLKFKKTEVKLLKLKRYYVQREDSSCRLHAVVFTTVKNKRICSDPGSPWTKWGVAYLQPSNQNAHPRRLRGIRGRLVGRV
ncbi:unnamed protein product [Lota lota]